MVTKSAKKSATESYDIVETKNGWSVDHDGTMEGAYETRQAAFSAAVGAASNAIKDGNGVRISVAAPSPGESALGTE
jgi:hypothetical protein